MLYVCCWLVACVANDMWVPVLNQLAAGKWPVWSIIWWHTYSCYIGGMWHSGFWVLMLVLNYGCEMLTTGKVSTGMTFRSFTLSLIDFVLHNTVDITYVFLLVWAVYNQILMLDDITKPIQLLLSYTLQVMRKFSFEYLSFPLASWCITIWVPDLTEWHFPES